MSKTGSKRKVTASLIKRAVANNYLIEAQIEQFVKFYMSDDAPADFKTQVSLTNMFDGPVQTACDNSDFVDWYCFKDFWINSKVEDVLCFCFGIDEKNYEDCYFSVDLAFFEYFCSPEFSLEVRL